MIICKKNAHASLLALFCLLYPLVFAQPIKADDWQLVWADEFNQDGLPNPQWWDFEEGSLRNNELQYYTVEREENARIENGLLIIEARKDGYQGHSVSSASLHSTRSASWTYGKIEVRAQLPGGRGTWPAIWMLGDNIGEAGWPGCGEIDIMEYVGYVPNTVYGTVHTTAYNHIANTEVGGNIQLADLTDAMHTYSIEWEPNEIRFYVDDQNYFIFQNDGQGNDATWPFHRPQHLKLNLAIGGDWGGAEGVDNAIYPAKFQIDYVRAYQRPQSPPYTVSLTANGLGSLRIEPEKDAYQEGEVVTLVADPDLGMRLGKWKNVQLPRSLRAPYTIDRNLQISADFLNPNALNLNGDFSNDLSGWYNWIGGGATASISINSSEQAILSVTKAGTENWHTQFGQGGIALEANKTYQLQFDAWTLSGTPALVAGLTMNSEPFTSYASTTADLTDTPKTFTLDYTHASSSNPNARIEFGLGTQTGSIALDNVTLSSPADERLSPYEAWKRDHNIRPGADAEDPDADQRPNLLEYLLQSDPFLADSPVATATAHSTRSGVLITPAPFLHHIELPAIELTIETEQSTDLQTWSPTSEETQPLPFKRLKLSAASPIDD